MASLVADNLNISTNTQSITNRCGSCNKKLGLLPFSCKCGGIYCALHRADATHNCKYDYQAENKKCLSTNMVKLAEKKIQVL
jgi:predicted nucleic acid binding AN1-type Zn finger protein